MLLANSFYGLETEWNMTSDFDKYFHILLVLKLLEKVETWFNMLKTPLSSSFKVLQNTF